MRRGTTVGCIAVALLLCACSAQMDVHYLADDADGGRNNGSVGSAEARSYLIGGLRLIGAQPVGAGAGAGADPEAYEHAFVGGTNIVALLPGTDLADEHVLVGAHYDGLGSSCRTADAADTICNGATDNATGVAVVMDVARELSRHPHRRSVIIALWDREEDGLLGSRAFVQAPPVPLQSIKTYVNFDIQGANLLPSLRDTSFAIGAETGGPKLQSLVDEAIGSAELGTRPLSVIFGQGRSDHAVLIGAGVPSVFFSDSTGPCYHTAQDDEDVVDHAKLAQQIAIAQHLVRDLTDADALPALATGQPLATYADAITIDGVLDRAASDLGRFTPTQQAQIGTIRQSVATIVAEGPLSFDDTDIASLLSGSVTLVSTLSTGPCDGFLE